MLKCKRIMLLPNVSPKLMPSVTYYTSGISTHLICADSLEGATSCHAPRLLACYVLSLLYMSLLQQ
jgi:hypothetical protein